MPRIEINGTKLHYQQIGRGPDVLLIHGLFSNIAFWWAHVAPALAKTHRVTALDLRGHGLSGMTERGYRAIDLATDVVALMRHLNMTDVHVVAHSFGGAIALAVAMPASGLVKRMTLADAWVPSLQQQLALPNIRSWPKLKEKLRARGVENDGDLPVVAMAFLEELAEAPDSTFAKMRGAEGREAWMPINRTSRGVLRWRRLMATTHAWKEFYRVDALGVDVIAKLDLPVDLIYGARSGYHQTRDGLIDHLPDVTSHETNGGHYFPIMQPQVLTDCILTQPDRQRTTVQGGLAG